jgi:hypothetical protein
MIKTATDTHAAHSPAQLKGGETWSTKWSREKRVQGGRNGSDARSWRVSAVGPTKPTKPRLPPFLASQARFKFYILHVKWLDASIRYFTSAFGIQRLSRDKQIHLLVEVACSVDLQSQCCSRSSMSMVFLFACLPLLQRHPRALTTILLPLQYSIITR